MNSFHDRWSRRAIHGTALSLAVIAAIWTAWLLLAGGFHVRVLGITLSSNEPLRPLMITASALSIAMLLGADERVVRWTTSLAEFAALVSARRAFNWVLAIALAITVLVVTITHGSRMAGGSDSFGYLSEAELWYQGGGLSMPIPWARDVPWPDAVSTFSPLGYHPGPEPGAVVSIAGHRPVFDRWAAVPVYSPGLPMLMAAAKWLGGHCAVFLVVPISAALFTIGTFALGTRLGSVRLGSIAALLVATSPIVLRFSLTQLSDVPVAAAWTLACYGAIGRTMRSAVGAAVALAVMLLIRPNLLPFVLLVVGWMCWRISYDKPSRLHLWRVAIVAGGAVAGALCVATIYWLSYGSPTVSGYGETSSFFGLRNVVPNLANYARWFVNDRTLVGCLGLVALLLPLKRLWPRAGSRSLALFAAAVVVAIIEFCAFSGTDNDAYLRFFLPVFPMIMIGLAAMALFAARRHRLAGLAVAGGVLVLVLYGLHGSKVWLNSWPGEVQQLELFARVRTATPENSVMISAEHSGPVWYHAARVPLRWDHLSPDSMDVAVAWLSERGVRAYAVLDDWEVAEISKRFAGRQIARTIAAPPALRAGHISFFELGSTQVTGTEEIPSHGISHRCLPPAGKPALVWKP